MSDVAIALFWHQHQPYYPDDVGGENPMPWVRLHGVKDYWGMAKQLLEYPAMRCTINLVPSLLAQIVAYTDHGASDRPMRMTAKPADGLSEEDSLYLLEHFFMANAERMIRPWPRFWELYQRRAAGRNSAREALRRFNARDLRDLQTWFNLAWIHPLAILQDAELRGLTEKGRHFSEAEKILVLDKQIDLMRQIIPLHKKLVESGQVELTTTPYYHPILPLLFDKKLAREAMPHLKLPRYTGGYAEDAGIHVRRAMEAHERMFGVKPTGIWPAEGSVCQTMIPLLAQHGVHWIATDEGVLSQATQGFISRDEHNHIRNPSHLYRPYRVQEGEAALDIIFRDHALSDMIGFHYQHSDGNDAANDFVKHLHNIRQAVEPDRTPLVSVILDGENCWEHYPNGGVPFLRALYDKCTKTPGIRPVKVGEFLKENPPRDTLPHLFAGSWINHNFAIWVGHEEDNAGWDALHQAREFLKRREASVPSEVAMKAWAEIYIAEGSDWFWWYGDDHSSAQDALFDYLFRKHLQNVYVLLGETAPPELSRPISKSGQRPLHTLPRGFLDVKVDGRETFFEWLAAGRYVCQNERGTMAQVTIGPIRQVLFGFDLRHLHIRVDFEQKARKVLEDFDVFRLAFAEPDGLEVSIQRPGRMDHQIVVRRNEREIAVVTTPVLVGIDRIVELSIPFDLLGVQIERPLTFAVELEEGGQIRDRAPREGAISLVRPSADFEQIMWDV